MALADTQIVYVPKAGKALEAPWGEGVATSVVQKFTDHTQLGQRWPQPVPSGSVCATQNDDSLYMSDGTVWRKIVTELGNVVIGGDVQIGQATVTSADLITYGNLALRGPTANRPQIIWQSTNPSVSTLGSIQHNTNGFIYNTINAGEYHAFQVNESNVFVVQGAVGTISQNVRITGFTKATGYLQIGGDGAQIRVIDTNTKTGNADAWIGFYAKGTVDAPGPLGGLIGYNNVAHLTMENRATNSSMYLKTPYAIGFTVGGVEGMRLYDYTTGPVLVFSKTAINPAVTGIELHPTGTISMTRGDNYAGIVVNKEGTGGTGSGTEYCRWMRDTVTYGSITRNAATAETNYNRTSDGRWKGNVADLSADEAISRLQALRPVSYQWKYDEQGHESEAGTPSGAVCRGFIAQELVEVVPGAVEPGQGTEAEHWSWVARMQERAEAEIAYQEAQASGGWESAPRELPPAEDDPFTPWMSDLSVLIPDLVAAVRTLVNRVETLEAA